MGQKEQISGLQMALLMYTAILATAVLLIPSISASFAMQDMWISPLWTVFVGATLVFGMYRLHLKFPGENLIQYIPRIVGRVPGVVMTMGLILVQVLFTGVIVREYSDFVIGAYLNKTPDIMIMFVMIAVCAYCVYQGIEVMGRCAIFFVPIFIFLIFIVSVLLIPEFDVTNFMPVLGNGILPSMKGSFVIHEWISEFVLISFLFPFLGKKEKALKWGMISLGAVIFSMVIVNSVGLLLFGSIAARLNYPVMAASRYISYGQFVEHVESVVLTIWVTGTFLKITVFYYVSVISISHFLKLKNYRTLIFPVGLWIIVLAKWTGHSALDVSIGISTTLVVIAMVIFYLFPMLLVVIAEMRFRKPKEGAR
ncbi:hypothetical protein BVG16_22890 [Paenibacillus selenitireducens]|uniref:Uncharacterized protein n=1 Tax=Paenibacillus selenitireducens TaxID=1324314 RepID=A0A1T2X4W1_9BACL|nr:endospore germination permease [Paenibacillus selenitireducens]OPA74613.1 hypothetical protein BVG16_22890 [Paenibacillus selenitireducens]